MRRRLFLEPDSAYLPARRRRRAARRACGERMGRQITTRQAPVLCDAPPRKAIATRFRGDRGQPVPQSLFFWTAWASRFRAYVCSLARRRTAQGLPARASTRKASRPARDVVEDGILGFPRIYSARSSTETTAAAQSQPRPEDTARISPAAQGSRTGLLVTEMMGRHTRLPGLSRGAPALGRGAERYPSRDHHIRHSQGLFTRSRRRQRRDLRGSRSAFVLL